jgi:hypothetical protein
MMKKTAVLSAAICTVGLAGCMETTTSAPATMDDSGTITERLAGRTLTNENGTIVLGADGSVSGSIRAGELAGAWTERNGQYCRTFTAPERVVGTRCQDVRFNADGTVTFLGGVGGDTTWQIS